MIRVIAILQGIVIMEGEKKMVGIEKWDDGKKSARYSHVIDGDDDLITVISYTICHVMFLDVKNGSFVFKYKTDYENRTRQVRPKVPPSLK